MATYSSRFSLPCEWDRRPPGRHGAAVAQYLKVEGLTVKYVGPGRDDSQAAAVRSDNPVPPDVPLYYFEAQVVARGAEGYIGIGFAAEDVKADRLPGWEPRSYGYHGDDGCAFHGSGQGRAYGPRYTEGDVIGCLLDRAAGTIRFFKNGADLGIAFRGVAEPRLFPTVGLRTPQEEVRANFGAGGSASFAVDLAALRAAFAEAALDAVRSTRLPAALLPAPVAGGSGGASGSASGSGSAAARWPLLAGIVFDYLLHHRCWRAAEALARDVLGGGGGTGGSGSGGSGGAGGGDAEAVAGGNGGGGDGGGGGNDTDTEMLPATSFDAAATATTTAAGGGGATAGDGADSGDATAAAAAASAQQQQPPPQGGLPADEVEDALRRQRIHDAAAAGDVDGALRLVEAGYGAAALAGAPALEFCLRVQQFLELVRARAPPQVALEFARSRLGAGGGGGSGGTGGGGPAAAADEELLADAVSLLAYADPEASPCGALLSTAARGALADRLNGALLAARGRAAAPALERLYRQLVVAVEELRRGHEPRALALDVAGACLGAGSGGSGAGGGGAGGSGAKP